MEQSHHLPTWLENPHDPADRAIAPLIGSGEVRRRASRTERGRPFPGDEHSTQPIRRDAAGFDEPEIPRLDDDRYGAGVDEDPEA